MLKRALFICYWSISDNLTRATVLPRLKVLQQRPDIETVVLVTIERDTITEHANDALLPLTKIKHQPYQSGKQKGNLAEKIGDFIRLPAWLVHLAKVHNLDTVLAQGAPAGALAYKVWKRTKLSFYVSSFEPHAAYMAESEVWTKHSLKYMFQSRWETKQKALAAGLMPVSENYKNQLIREGISGDRIFTVPCSVNATTFKFDSRSRSDLRDKLELQNATVGIYVGKFGSLYYDTEAFFVFQTCFELIPNFRLIILTPESLQVIKDKLSEYNIDSGKVYIDSIQHEQVPAYLSASDFAFATFKPGPSKRHLSPIKVGEYWANGLPVLLTAGIGDDSDIIKQEGGGALFNLQQEGSLGQALRKIQEILKDPSHRQNIPVLAKKYRSPDKIKEAYDYFFGSKEDEL